MKYLEPSFTVGQANTDAYRKSWARMFGKRTGEHSGSAQLHECERPDCWHCDDEDCWCHRSEEE